MSTSPRAKHSSSDSLPQSAHLQSQRSKPSQDSQARSRRNQTRSSSSSKSRSQYHHRESHKSLNIPERTAESRNGSGEEPEGGFAAPSPREYFRNKPCQYCGGPRKCTCGSDHLCPIEMEDARMEFDGSFPGWPWMTYAKYWFLACWRVFRFPQFRRDISIALGSNVNDEADGVGKWKKASRTAFSVLLWPIAIILICLWAFTDGLTAVVHDWLSYWEQDENKRLRGTPEPEPEEEDYDSDESAYSD